MFVPVTLGFILDLLPSVIDWYLQDFDIEVFSDDPAVHPGAKGQLCFSFFSDFGDANTRTLRCMNPVKGRYVRIKKRQYKKNTEVLVMCEVAVHPKIYENNCSFSYRSPSTFVPYTDKFLKTTPRHTIIADIKTCMIVCTTMWACDGFNFKILDSSSGNGTCNFVSVSLANFYKQSGWTYYQAICSQTPAQPL